MDWVCVKENKLGMSLYGAMHNSVYIIIITL